jgi:hypothetical protein
MVFCRLWHDDDQTKRTHHLHICGGDSDVLTWGVAAPQTIVEADAAPSPWWHVETKIIFARGSRRTVRRIVKRMSRAKIAVKLVPKTP